MTKHKYVATLHIKTLKLTTCNGYSISVAIVQKFNGEQVDVLPSKNQALCDLIYNVL